MAAAKQKLASPGAREHPDFRELLGRKDIDAVVIGAPDHWHVPMIRAAVEAGKDVYCEKPVSHTIEEGERLLAFMAGSRQVVQIGYQQRSWNHFQHAREVVASGKLGKISLVLTSWYQDYLNLLSAIPDVDTGKLNWKAFLGSAPDQPYDHLRFARWRWFWDFGGGHLTDLFSHLLDVVHWYTGQNSPRAVMAMGGRNALPKFECPDTIDAAYEYPGGFNVVYTGTLVGSLEGGTIVIRGSDAMMKLTRDGFNVYPERVIPFEKTRYPDPLASERADRDGTADHVKNFLDCVRSRRTPNADVKSAVATARAAHLGNQAYRSGTRIQG
jgi:predicted dehydrogenase